MPTTQRRDLVAEATADKAEAVLLTETFKETTALTWLWSFLFGPIYFWVHGFVGLGFVQLAINVVTVGIGSIIAPFLAYHAWNKRAQAKAENMIAASKLRQSSG